MQPLKASANHQPLPFMRPVGAILFFGGLQRTNVDGTGIGDDDLFSVFHRFEQPGKYVLA
ncbi:MAG: hypothetical protein ACYCTV_09620 [Leptospirales bacterium]